MMLADLIHQAPLAALKGAGYDGAFGYSSHSRSKCPDPGYAKAMVAAGGVYAVVFEDGAQQALRGYQQGASDAAYANHDADVQGYPANCAIYWTADFDGTWQQVSEYARGWHEHSARPLGVYADGDIIRAAKAAGFVKYGWRTCSGGFHGSHDLTGVDLVQVCAGEAGLVPVPGFSVDTNRTQPGVIDIGAWTNPTPPPPSGFLMALSDKQQSDLYDAIMADHLIAQQVQKILLGDKPQDVLARLIGSNTRIEKDLAAIASPPHPPATP